MPPPPFIKALMSRFELCQKKNFLAKIHNKFIENVSKICQNSKKFKILNNKSSELSKNDKSNKDLSLTAKDLLTVIANIAIITTLARQKKDKEARQPDATSANVAKVQRQRRSSIITPKV